MTDMSRRRMFQAVSASAGGLALNGLFPGWARSAAQGLVPALPTLEGPNIDLTISHAHLDVDGRMGHAVTINGTVPGPLLRMTEGQNVRLSVKNDLDEETSIHWHGLLVPFQMIGA